MSGASSLSLLALLAVLVPITGGLLVFTAGRWNHRAAGLAVVGVVSLGSFAIVIVMTIAMAWQAAHGLHLLRGARRPSGRR